MALPYPTKVVLPFDIATAQDMNERHANDVALADGTGLDDGAVTPSKRGGGFKIGVIPSATLNSTGNKSITGVGFKPKLVRFTVLESTGPYIGFSVGAMDGDGNQYSASTGSGTSQRRISSDDYAITRSNDTATTLQAEYVSMDADGFTINVTTAGGVDVAYEALA